MTKTMYFKGDNPFTNLCKQITSLRVLINTEPTKENKSKLEVLLSRRQDMINEIVNLNEK